ncbi:hypothetical protein DRN43_02320 [Thermococci archaeon]|nr:MAG: hypothetical protein DRJ03_12595 [Chloroflexota bacterium]RLF90152.1 MAG: hypothetical protein DRN43_02320 [Thermococci archaeon]
MRVRKYLVALASWRRSLGIKEDTGDPFYLVFTLGPKGGIHSIMAVSKEKIDKLGKKGLFKDYQINPRFQGDVYGPMLTKGVLNREIEFLTIFRGDLLEKLGLEGD